MLMVAPYSCATQLKRLLQFVKAARKPGRHFYAKEELQRLKDAHEQRELRHNLRGRVFQVTGEVFFDKHGEPEDFDVVQVARTAGDPQEVVPTVPEEKVLAGAAVKVPLLPGILDTAADAVRDALRGHGRSFQEQGVAVRAHAAADVSTVATPVAAAVPDEGAGTEQAALSAAADSKPAPRSRAAQRQDPRARMRSRKARVYSTSEEDEDMAKRRKAVQEKRAAAAAAAAAARAAAEQGGAGGYDDDTLDGSDSDSDAPLGKAAAARAQVLAAAANPTTRPSDAWLPQKGSDDDEDGNGSGADDSEDE
jgi:hypothetical protein